MIKEYFSHTSPNRDLAVPQKYKIVLYIRADHNHRLSRSLKDTTYQIKIYPIRLATLGLIIQYKRKENNILHRNIDILESCIKLYATSFAIISFATFIKLII